MAQAGVMTSRPGTQNSLTARLPQIQHPLSRLGNPTAMDVQGTNSRVPSRAASRASQSGRPLAAEQTYGVTPRRSLPGSARSASVRNSRNDVQRPFSYTAIPEGVEVTEGDPAKVKMPIFGNKAEMAPSRLGTAQSGVPHRLSSRLQTPQAQNRLEIDELEMLLRQKVHSGYFEIKKRFKDNDPEGKGNCSRDAVFRILVTVMNRQLTPSQFSRLMERLGFMESRAVISFQEFYAAFREAQTTEYPRWMDPIQRQWQERDQLLADQVNNLLREKARQRVKDIADLIPQSNPDGSGFILKPEFRNALNRMGYYMDDIEFERLWAKYDPEGCGTINGERMMKQLGINIESTDCSKDRLGMNSSGRTLRKKEAERQRSLDIENWIKSKFREGFLQMRDMFEACDTKKTGMATHDSFLAVLKRCGLHLEKEHLSDFLARCHITPTKTEVPYREFLHAFQDRSEQGMPHKILTDPKHGYNHAESPDDKSTITALETQLMNMFQKDFLAMLGTFHKIDKLGLDVVSQEEFRAAIESRFGLEMTNDQFRSLIDHCPLDEEGAVRYADFMAQFDTKGKAPSLFQMDLAGKQYRAVGVLPRDPSPPIPEEGVYAGHGTTTNAADILRERDLDHNTRLPDPVDEEYRNRRSPQELFRLIKDLLKKNYQRVEEQFSELDEMNTGRLTQEMMYKLLLKFNLDPEVTRGEIRDLWKTFITNTDKTLDFRQLVRHFGYSLKSAAFPNAKICPPKKGDSDFQLRSRKLNCAADMLQDNLRSKIDYMWEDLRREFCSMDPYGTGFVSAEEFHDVLTELCVHLSDYELQMLTKKFDFASNGRVSYIEFLKPFAMKKQVWRNGSNMLSLLQHPNAGLPIDEIGEPPQKGLHGITSKLRDKLSGEWKNLRRAFKKLDRSNQGYLSLSEFRSVLKLANVILDEDEIYHLMSYFDEDMSGKISYSKFISETFKPDAKSGQGRGVRSSMEQ